MLSVVRKDYTVSTDWEGAKYSGINLDWDYENYRVHLSMPGYCKEALVKFGHELRRVTHEQHKHAIPVYGRNIQHAKEEDETPQLNEEGKKFVQQVTGTFMYYARAVDPTILVALSAIASDQAAPTELTMQKVLYLLLGPC